VHPERQREVGRRNIRRAGKEEEEEEDGEA